MPLMDGTGPIGGGSLTGGRQSRCGGAGALGGRRGRCGRGSAFYTTGPARRKSAAEASRPVGETVGGSPGLLAGLESKLAEVIERLDRVESAGRD